MIKRMKIAVVAGVLAIGMAFLGAVPAQASTSGGNGDPSGCANPMTVASTPIWGARGTLAGKQIGRLEIRWSNSCYGNWARTVLYGNTFSSPATIEQKIESEGRAASSYVTGIKSFNGGSTTWSPYIRLNNWASTACAQVWVSSDFDTLNFHTAGARLCA